MSIEILTSITIEKRSGLGHCVYPSKKSVREKAVLMKTNIYLLCSIGKSSKERSAIKDCPWGLSSSEAHS